MSGNRFAFILLAAGLALAIPGLGLTLAAVYASSSLGPSIVPVVAVVGLAASTIGLAAFSAGVACYVFGPVVAGRAERQYASYGTILGSFYLAVLIANIAVGLYVLAGLGFSLATGGLGRFGSRGFTPAGLILSTLAQQLALLAVLYFRVVRPRVLVWRDLGVVTRGWARTIGIGLLAGVAVVVVNALVESVMAALGIRQTQYQLFAVLRQGTPLQFAAMIAGGAVLAAFVEESFFRGYVFGGLCRKAGATHGYVASALLFAAAHLPYWQAMPAIFAAGLIFALVAHRSRSIVPGMIAHAVNNALGLAVIYFGVA